MQGFINAMKVVNKEQVFSAIYISSFKNTAINVQGRIIKNVNIKVYLEISKLCFGIF
jgi:hypothetical protein